VNVAVPPEVQGESLLGLIPAKGGAQSGMTADSAGVQQSWKDRQAYAETDYPHTAFGWSALRSLRTGKYLFVQAPRRELYDEATDPKAEHNVAPSSTAVVDTLTARVDSFRQKTSNNREAPKATLDPTAAEKLAALGYMSSGKFTASGPMDQGADPKDKIQISNMVHQANALRESGRCNEAVPVLQQVIAKEPNMPGMYAKLGECLLDLKQYQESVPVLRKAVELEPDSATAHLQLAKGMMGSGPELEFAIAKVPGFADAHVFLEMAYARTNRIPETIKECKTVLEFMPDHFGSYLILGRFLEMSGDFEGAIPNLKKAAALQPKAPDPHIILADVYEHLGRKAEAAQERAEAERLGARAE
jgi:tetratricopeptide (TPR) repeat protein